MKNAVRNTCFVMLIIFSLILLATILNKDSRKYELERNLATAVEQTVDNMMKSKTYEVSNYNEFIADFIENLSVTLNTKSDITVNILKADIEKGILSVEVVETFKHPNGNTGQVNYTKTVVFEDITDSETEKPTYTVKFYESQADMQNDQNCYKQYDILSGDSLIQPKDPTPDVNQTFTGWKDSAGNPADFTAKVTANTSYYAVFATN